MPPKKEAKGGKDAKGGAKGAKGGGEEKGTNHDILLKHNFRKFVIFRQRKGSCERNCWWRRL